MANIDTASRLSSANGCAKKFQFQYVEKLPQRDGGAFILGNTCHDGLQAWFEERGEGPVKPGRLWELMQEAWIRELPAPLWRHVKPDLENALELEKIAGMMKIARGVVAPEATKDYKALPQYAKREQLAERVRRWLDANENVIRWSKSEPPTKAWMVARAIAGRLEQAWLNRPVPFLVESPFMVEYGGFTWRGRLDVYGPINEAGEVEPYLIDWKTGAQPPSPMELFVQACIYHLAMTQQGHEITEVQFHMLRLPYTDNGAKRNPVRVDIDPERHYPMLLEMRRSKEYVLNFQGIFSPSYSFACRSCDYAAFCQRDLGIIKGDAKHEDD